MVVKSRLWRPAEDAILRDLYPDLPTTAVAARLGRPVAAVYRHAHALGIPKSAAYRASPAACRLRRGDAVGAAFRFAPGRVPANKGLRRPGWSPGRMSETQFKPGVRMGVALALWKPIGTERVNGDGYLDRKVNDDLPPQRRWRAVHLLLWEAAHGPVPPHHAVVFVNGNKQDIRLENLECISRGDLARRNVRQVPIELRRITQLRGAITATINLRVRREKHD